MNIRNALKNLGKLVAVAAVALSLQTAHAITVGGKNYTEQQLMAEMTTQLLKSKGIDASKKAGMGSAVLRAAQENGHRSVAMVRKYDRRAELWRDNAAVGLLD